MHTRVRRARLAPATCALAATAALCVTATASADVTTTVNGSQLTLTGSAGDDTIVLGAANGVITVNGGATTLAADPSAFITVDARDGNDTIDAHALGGRDYFQMIANGGPGTDTLLGGANPDLLMGDTGNDHLEGNGDGDALLGGDGDDTATWRAGDGFDEFNGAADTADDRFTAVPDEVVRGDVTLHGDGVTMSFNAEELDCNGGGGNDVFAPGTTQPGESARLGQLTTLHANGGDGDDVITGFQGGER